MLFLILLLTLLAFQGSNGSINLTYIVKKDGNKIMPSCIAEEFERYEAIGWVYPIPSDQKNLPNISTKFIPTLNNNYNCEFSKNSLCTQRWALQGWSIDDSSAKTKEFIADYRWEDLPTILISNNTRDFKERIEITSDFKSGISVRAGGVIELLVCSGWNPYNHPCYHFNIDSREIYLNKYSVLPQELNDTKSEPLETYKANSNIISPDEWRNFIISLDEKKTIRLFDVNLNRIVVQHNDEENFNPMYLLVRSNEPSLWKFHHNEFLYTKTTQTTRLGPQLTLFNKDICISLMVSLCQDCQLNFFYLDQRTNTKIVLKSVRASQNNQWMEIKIKERDVHYEKLNLFAESKLDNTTINQTGFWAIDNVRICNENEVKVTHLKLNDLVVDDEEEEISCQLVKKPSWRPKKLVYNTIKDFPQIDTTSDSTSIKLSWGQNETKNEISYFVLYQANDLCTSEPHNLERVQSSGFLTTKYNELVIDNLVPYTWYNITVSTVLHEADRFFRTNTLGTVEPTYQETPQQVQVRAFDTGVEVSWQKVPCTLVYGKLVYTLTVTNETLNFTKTLSIQTETSYKIDGLRPYTLYSLNITTARNGMSIYRNINSKTTIYKFTTLPGIPDAVANLTLYSIDQNSASLRYVLPKNLNGIPKDVQVNRCYKLSASKCKPSFYNITNCPLWPQEFCVFVNNLMPLKYYTFKLSLRNLNTVRFGPDAVVSGFTVDQAPGPPLYVRGKTVDCDNSTDFCHLNVTWTHPYEENGTITSFNIILTRTDEYETDKSEKIIQDVYPVANKSYLPTYSYLVKFVPYGAQYNLSVQSANASFKSDFTEVPVNIDNLGEHINQKPELLDRKSDSLTFKLARLDARLESYITTVIVQDFDNKTKIKPGIFENEKITKKLCHNFGNTWISQVVKISDKETKTIHIDSSEKGKINPKTQYCITFIITNRYKGIDHEVVYYKKLETPEAPPPVKEASTSSKSSHLYVLLLLLLLIPIGFFIYRWLSKRKMIKKTEENGDNVYETLPFEECENNCVNNDNYDHLLHK